MKKGQAFVAAVLALIMGAMVSAVIYLAKVFPNTLAVWEEEARELSAAQVLMANVSIFCTSYGLLILPILLVGFSASLAWLILAVMKKSTANNEVQAIS